MAAEDQEMNGNQTPEESKPSTTRSRTATKASKEKEVVALSVKNKNESKGLQLMEEPDRLPGNRPIEASHLRVVNTYSAVGGTRPVISSGMEVSGTLAISGNRPIAVSHLNISETYSVMGNRPVAPNEVDDPETLMGFLD